MFFAQTILNNLGLGNNQEDVDNVEAIITNDLPPSTNNSNAPTPHGHANYSASLDDQIIQQALQITINPSFIEDNLTIRHNIDDGNKSIQDTPITNKDLSFLKDTPRSSQNNLSGKRLSFAKSMTQVMLDTPGGEIEHNLSPVSETKSETVDNHKTAGSFRFSKIDLALVDQNSINVTISPSVPGSAASKGSKQLDHIEESQQQSQTREEELSQEQKNYESFFDQNSTRTYYPKLMQYHDGSENEKNQILNIDITKPLGLPYNSGCISRMWYYIQTFIVINPRLYAIKVLVQEIWSRILVIFDMYTDILVAYALYKGSERIWFMLSCLFLAFPFVLVWSASLRFIDDWMQKKLFGRLDGNTCCAKTMGNMFLIIYMFPPIGSILVAFYEVYWVLTDVWRCFKAFIFGSITIEAQDRQSNAFKNYRKAIEIFAESLPQTLLQVYIFVRITWDNDITAQQQYGISLNDLAMSLGVSLLNLCVNFYQFRSEADLHGMYVMEYALSVLQLAEVPIQKFVPRLPAIEKGLVEEVNFGGFKFDKASVTPLLEALHSTKCKLKTIKLSLASLSKLDLQSCKMLGYLLYNAGVNVTISRTASLLDVKRLFDSIDLDHNGYLEEDEFSAALNKLNCSIKRASDEEKKRVFQELAIRRLKKRDRIYFHDFFDKTTSVQCENNLSFDFDLTGIEYPLQFIFYRIKQEIQRIINSDNKRDYKLNNVNAIKEEQILIRNMKKLYQFCEGFSLLKQVDANTKQHVFYSVLDAFYIQDGIDKYKKKQIEKYRNLLWLLFENLLESPSIDAKLMLTRNNVFKKERHRMERRDDDNEQSGKHNEYSELTESLKSDGYNGYNIFEYCFIHKHRHRAKCELFSYLFDSFLKKAKKNNRIALNTDYLQSLILNKGKLYHLFIATNGFHVKDKHNNTPLYYAVLNGQDDVVEFFSKYIIPKQDKESDDYQDYLHSIVGNLLSQKNINIDLLRILLSSGKININHYSKKNGYLANRILKYRKQLKTDKKEKNAYILLRCLQILDEFGYDFVNNCDLQTNNNILHFATLLNDYEAIEYIIINLFEHNRQQRHLSNLLNAKNKKNQTALETAMNIGYGTKIAIYLWKFKQQKFDVESFLSKCSVDTMEGNINWTRCLQEMLQKTKRKTILKKLDQKSRQILMNFIKSLFESMMLYWAGIKDESEKPAEYYVLNEIVMCLRKNLGSRMQKRVQ